MSRLALSLRGLLSCWMSKLFHHKSYMHLLSDQKARRVCFTQFHYVYKDRLWSSWIKNLFLKRCAELYFGLIIEGAFRGRSWLTVVILLAQALILRFREQGMFLSLSRYSIRENIVYQFRYASFRCLVNSFVICPDQCLFQIIRELFSLCLHLFEFGIIWIRWLCLFARSAFLLAD